MNYRSSQNPVNENVSWDLSNYTFEAISVLKTAYREARELNHILIWPEHILLGLLNEDGIAKTVLNSFGVLEEGIRSLAIRRIPSSNEILDKGLFSPRAMRVLERAELEAQARVDTEHILLGLVSGHSHIGFDLLNYSSQKIRHEVLKAIRSDETPLTKFYVWTDDHDSSPRLIMAKDSEEAASVVVQRRFQAINKVNVIAASEVETYSLKMTLTHEEN